MVNRLPYEVLSTVGLSLNQENQKNCALVCRAWRQPFQTLVFQKAVFLKPEQLQGFLEQKASLKQLVRGLHFDIPLNDQLFKSIAEQCPKVDTLTLFVNLLNNLSIPKTLSVIKKHWLNHLVKIRMDELILAKVLPLISDQVQDVTGGFEAFFNKQRKLIPMPQLKELDVEQEEGTPSGYIDNTVLNRMRLAYPKLKKLTLRYFDTYDTKGKPEYLPFPYVRSFHLINCNETTFHASEQIKQMFTDLHELSHLRTRQTHSNDGRFHATLIGENMNLYQLAVPHMNNMDFSTFEKLRALKHFHLEGSTETNVVTDRELLDLPALMTSMPGLQDLRIVGLFHVSAGESLDHYLCGTVGFCERNNGTNSNDSDSDRTDYELPYFHTDNDSNSDRDSNRDIDIYSETDSNRTDEGNIYTIKFRNMLPRKDMAVFGNGENLCKNSKRILRVKKDRAAPSDDIQSPQVNVWNIDHTLLSLQTYPDSQSIVFHFMVKLELDWVTIRTPLYEWIKKHLPSLQEFYVNHSEPYPFCEIPLGSNVRTFEIDFDARYKCKPLAKLMLTKEDDSVTDIRFIYNEQTDRYQPWLDYQIKEYEKLGFAFYSVDLKFSSSLSRLLICKKNMSDQLETTKMS